MKIVDKMPPAKRQGKKKPIAKNAKLRIQSETVADSHQKNDSHSEDTDVVNEIIEPTPKTKVGGKKIAKQLTYSEILREENAQANSNNAISCENEDDSIDFEDDHLNATRALESDEQNFENEFVNSGRENSKQANVIEETDESESESELEASPPKSKPITKPTVSGKQKATASNLVIHEQNSESEIENSDREHSKPANVIEETAESESELEASPPKPKPKSKQNVRGKQMATTSTVATHEEKSKKPVPKKRQPVEVPKQRDMPTLVSTDEDKEEEDGADDAEDVGQEKGKGKTIKSIENGLFCLNYCRV